MYAFIGLGSNLGERTENIKEAITRLKNTPGITLCNASSLIETEPLGGPPQPKYLNGVIKIETDLSARMLLDRLQEIERALGRKRTIKNGPRTIDLDILLYGEEAIDEPDLKIPHPRMFEREFVMQPFLEIAPTIAKRWLSRKVSHRHVKS